MATVALLFWVIVLLILLVATRARACTYGPPDFVIGRKDSPYMNRWWVIPRNRLFNIYLHQVLRSDDDRALHDHPWVNCSIVLKGGYWEVVPQQRPSADWPVPPTRTKWRGPGSIVLRRPSAAHRLVVGAIGVEGRGPCWSLFITGPNVRDWGFWCPRGWKKWTDFVDMTNTGAIGPGCGEATPGGRKGSRGSIDARS